MFRAAAAFAHRWAETGRSVQHKTNTEYLFSAIDGSRQPEAATVPALRLPKTTPRALKPAPGPPGEDGA